MPDDGSLPVPWPQVPWSLSPTPGARCSFVGMATLARIRASAIIESFPEHPLHGVHMRHIECTREYVSTLQANERAVDVSRRKRIRSLPDAAPVVAVANGTCAGRGRGGGVPAARS